jgi:hypothetical protein
MARDIGNLSDSEQGGKPPGRLDSNVKFEPNLQCMYMQILIKVSNELAESRGCLPCTLKLL